MKPLLRRVIEFDTHHRVTVALGIASIAFAFLLPQMDLAVSLMLAWNVFATSSLTLAWSGILLTDAETRVKESQLQDSSRAVIYGTIVVGAVVALFGAGHLLGAAKSLTPREANSYLMLAALTVALSWLLVHTLLTFHYTHLWVVS
jgi:uncharacterized membrane protein